tara:strand:- start:2705 stop:2887 length:183 start_codon:yes stop_codon:yes gene_type:complete
MEPHIIIDINLISWIYVGKKIVDAMTLSIHIDITLAIPFGSSFHPNDLIIELSQNFMLLT